MLCCYCGLFPKKSRVTAQELTIWLFPSSLQKAAPSLQNSSTYYGRCPCLLARYNAKDTGSAFLPSSGPSKDPCERLPCPRRQWHPGCTRSWHPSLEVHRLGFNRSVFSHAFQPSEYTDSFIYVFNVVNGQLNELRFVIFMVNLKSRSCWLILLVDGKTRRNCRPCCVSNKHFMLNYSGLEQKKEPDVQAQ